MGLFSWVFNRWLPIGVNIQFLGQPRVQGLLSNFDINSEGFVALDVRYVGYKRNEMTGYWFRVEDFSPNLSSIDIRSYMGDMVCFKNTKGEDNFIPTELKERNAKIMTLNKMLEIYKRKTIELLNIIENKNVSEARKQDTIEGAKTLKGLKELIAEKEIIKPGGDRSGSLSNSLFSNR